MSSRRFELILRFLHLNDSQTQPQRGQTGFDKLYKIRPLLNLLTANFRDNYTPSQFLSVDESMISFKGRLSFLQYLPKKPHKWGMKAWVLADAGNGYTWGWKLYTGKEDRAETGLAHHVVVDLVDDERLQGKGHVIVMDNFYSSPSLFHDLLSRGFHACGTVRKDRKGLPKDVCTATLQKGEIISSVDDSILALKWKDKRDVFMMSTYHNSSMVTKTRRSRAADGGVEDIRKPQVVEDYNQNMGGVDKSELVCIIHLQIIYIHTSLLSSTIFLINVGDQMIMYYGFSHRSVKWWKRVFFHLLDVALVNGYILYKAATESKKTQLQFRLSVAMSLIEGLQRPRHRHHSGAPELPLRLTERAFPEPIPDEKRADCKVCSVRGAGQRHQTRYRCKLCHTPLCLYPCFERYHTLKDYKIKY